MTVFASSLFDWLKVFNFLVLFKFFVFHVSSSFVSTAKSPLKFICENERFSLLLSLPNSKPISHSFFFLSSFALNLSFVHFDRILILLLFHFDWRVYTIFNVCLWFRYLQPASFLENFRKTKKKINLVEDKQILQFDVFVRVGKRYWTFH